ncbi:unnamed protein product [Blepharisma stoltei]|uniref:Uncharacterized protein n=1 Tax=Blepharisma stoltei TaxID=1481888 RepID=A0AAU9JML5_9CILI|nr:unnamed protein product [Blepharisma stoltei]
MSFKLLQFLMEKGSSYKRVLEIFQKICKEKEKTMRKYSEKNSEVIKVKTEKLPLFLYDLIGQEKPFSRTSKSKLETSVSKTPEPSNRTANKIIRETTPKETKLRSSLTYKEFKDTHNSSFRLKQELKLNTKINNIKSTELSQSMPRPSPDINLNRTFTCPKKAKTLRLNKLITQSLLSSGRPLFPHATKFKNEFIEKYVCN